VFKRWLADDLAANWATTDSLCGSLIAPLLLANPALVQSIRPWTRHRNFWVRRASAVSLVRHAARGAALDDVYDVATALQDDPADLIHKAVGWLLREAGRTDAGRLERYLLEHGASIPRTTVRYAIERFPAARRRALLTATRRQSSAPAHLNRQIKPSTR
jgi:3-methyladenine DNA glycosylase AlkD